MLNIGRRVGERIKIGDDVWVTVVDATAGRIRLGIVAPVWVKIVREELLPPEERFKEATRGGTE